jgi:hypothetical protein
MAIPYSIYISGRYFSPVVEQDIRLLPSRNTEIHSKPGSFHAIKISLGCC